VPVALNLVVDRSLWAGLDAHIVLSGFMRERLTAGGVPSDAIVIRPTSVPDPGPVTEPGDGLLFVGRLSDEKGVLPLLEAWRLSRASHHTSLTIIGGGPQLDEVKRRGEAIPGVKVLGRVSASVLTDSMRRCAAVVLPSLCYEGFPTVATEACAYGRPLIACDTPNARFFVGDAGWIAPPIAQEFASVIDQALTSRSDIVRYAENGRTRYEAEMTVEQSMARLMQAYEVAIRRVRERAG
jgi:glycosyltransferase involved in cell wall biosynthesis